MIAMKSQADIISAVIVIIIAITLVSTAYMWGLPLIRKRQDTALVERAKNYFDRENSNSLVRKMEFVAAHGGEDTFSLDIDGAWILYPHPGDCIDPACNLENNSIQFTFSAIVSDIGANQGWIPMGSGFTGPIGKVGTDRAGVVFRKADESPQGYDLTYKTWFRELEETSTKSHKYNLISAGPTASTGKAIRISRGEIYTDTATVPGKTLIITEIKLLLI